MTESGTRDRPAAVSSNGVPVPFDDRLFEPMRDSAPLLADPPALRARFDEDGYLLLRGLLDPERVRDLRADYFGRFDAGLLAPGTTPADGVFSGTVPAGLPAYGTAGHPAYELVRSAGFDGFTRQPRLRSLAETLLGAGAELAPRRILRHFHRGARLASRAHVDYDYMDQGSDRLVTMWIPLGDCPVECGGLVYLTDSHRVGRAALEPLRAYTDRPDDPRPVSNDLHRTARTLGGRWLWTDYRAGDLVLHSPHTVHASLDNTTDAMRLSIDLRFRLRQEEPDRRWDGSWSADDGF
ncbi:MAG TPA: phytanoyl-CoA dioxygenase family protein [Jatrophihabitans sp.]|nr:phytanoyl-CoA dioxygenase family protein [Jatrophihabitans sp.]